MTTINESEVKAVETEVATITEWCGTKERTKMIPASIGSPVQVREHKAAVKFFKLEMFSIVTVDGVSVKIYPTKAIATNGGLIRLTLKSVVTK